MLGSPTLSAAHQLLPGSAHFPATASVMPILPHTMPSQVLTGDKEQSIRSLVSSHSAISNNSVPAAYDNTGKNILQG